MNPLPLVSTEWLAEHLRDAGVVVVDASWHLAAMKRDPVADFAAAHIPGAQFFSINVLSDHATDLPHMMPTPGAFAAGVGALGIGDDSFVVAYDTAGIYSAARAWWMFRAMGHAAVAVLDGGFPKWLREKRPVEQGPALPRHGRFTPRPAPELVRNFNAVEANLHSRREQILDARSPGRFTGDEKEPRPRLRSGHIPGSRNVYYADLIAQDGTLKPRDQLARLFAERGVDLARPAVTSCGSGITAAVVLLALDVAGAKQTALYDGSWTEWGSREGAPVATGPA